MDLPLGFTIGTWGLYTTWNFSITDLAGYEKGYQTYDGDGKATFSPEDYHDRGNRAYERYEWILGYKINLVTGFLMLPIGFGANHSNELRLFDHIYSSTPDKIAETEWMEPVNWTTTFVAEIGLEIVLWEHVSIGCTYRLKDFKESSFTLSGGVVFLKQED
ncbi:MAG: hypothetical protein LBT00_00065 [Spirochaetaceae bacterium]|jgi:opacity protein-like surface antigen|nr:hypothetical protein [Spirochaetaceae bacterium]